MRRPERGKQIARIDPALVEAARAGDGAALEALLRATRPWVRRQAERHCAGQLAEEATQEALLTLSRRLPALRSVAAFPLWLVRIVARICIGLVSPLWRRIEALQDVSLGAAAPENVELRLDLERAVEALPATLRETVLLFYYGELPVAEIGAQLGISAAAVKVRLHRGRALLRERLAGREAP